ncbi:unnamed protein product [Cuscuta epithymum]|uniref:F-box domain-containing protein n=1 Tax=Cuscuta epithymum TaxID=186058 RepID=A0AAV0FY62_9ASTE|nr:unnamed protein product [Cuscuta epithymum]
MTSFASMSEKSLAEETQESAESDLPKGEEFGAESVGIYSKNVRENNQIRNSIDRISALPDCLLVHIISFLDLKKAATTSILAKRWQFLWAELRNLEFGFYHWGKSKETKNTSDFVAWVNSIIATRRGNYLEKLRVTFKYEDCFAPDVDNWLEFAIKSKVKELDLGTSFSKDLYILREMMYYNLSLTSLYLEGCILDPKRTIVWSSLTTLHLSRVDLPEYVVEKILSGCPVLNSLNLSMCRGFTCLEINSKNLCKLRVWESEEGSEPLLQISAPYLKDLNLWLSHRQRQLKLKNISSLVSASFDYSDSFGHLTSEDVSNTKEVFEKIQHVEELNLGPGPVKALAGLMLNGWQLPKYKLWWLKIELVCGASETIPGILGLLESSPVIETLVIICEDSPHGLDDHWGPPAKDNLVCDLLHLKMIKLIDLADPDLDGEPLLTLARILLKRTPVLEYMETYVSIKDADFFAKIGLTLLSYPRSSPNAVIDLSDC